MSESRELIAAAEPMTALKELVGFAGLELTNFKGEPMDKIKFIFACQNDEMLTGDDLANEVFPLKYWYIHRVELENNGELTPAVRTVLCDPDGNKAAFVSDSVASALASICHHFGIGPYDPPLALKIAKKRTRRGFSIYTLSPQ